MINMILTWILDHCLMILCPLLQPARQQIWCFHPIMMSTRITFNEESLIVSGWRESIIGRSMRMPCSSWWIWKKQFVTLLYNKIRRGNHTMTTSTKSSGTSTPSCMPNYSLSASFFHPIGWLIHQQRVPCLPKWWNYWTIIQPVSCQLFIGRRFLLQTSTVRWYSTDVLPLRNWGVCLEVSQMLEYYDKYCKSNVPLIHRWIKRNRR